MTAVASSPAWTGPVLAALGCRRATPSIRQLNRLIQAYVRRVPFESVSRILKRQAAQDLSACPRWPDEFWQEALSYGTGGTCFECNLAFFSLLTALGYAGYLTINDMEKPACHTACIILLGGQKYLVDVAIPLYCALPLHRGRTTRRDSLLHRYSIHPLGESRYRVQRSHHPQRNIYTLVDIPVPMEEYEKALEKDYGVTGYFLDRIIIVKIIENRLWRFNSPDQPYRLEGFDKTCKKEINLAPDSLARSLGGHFGMEPARIAAALACLGLPRW